ncbi:hypothetical protein KIPB_011354, partial [Kipferlia bialata]|eukprot:g11354.t1
MSDPAMRGILIAKFRRLRREVELDLERQMKDELEAGLRDRREQRNAHMERKRSKEERERQSTRAEGRESVTEVRGEGERVQEEDTRDKERAALDRAMRAARLRAEEHRHRTLNLPASPVSISPSPPGRAAETPVAVRGRDMESVETPSPTIPASATPVTI